MMDEELRSSLAKKVTWAGAWSNLFLAVIKVVFGWLGSSQALIADGIHSFSDLLTDALVLFASHYGSRKADVDHPYGHHRIETAATLFLALLLIVAGAGIAYHSLMHLIDAEFERPKGYVLSIVVISIVLNELLYHYTIQAGRKIKSNLIVANAWHHRSDAASSVVVLIGVIGSLLGYDYFDAMAAVIVGAMIIKMGASLGWSSVRELVDTGVPADTLHGIEVAILSVPGVLALHQLRTRCMADKIFVDAHILVNSRLSVSEGHYISSKVHETLMEKLDIYDVTIHVDPENDEFAPLSRDLPPRPEINALIMSHLAGLPGVEAITEVRLHYLAGALKVELALPMLLLEDGCSAEGLRQSYVGALAPIKAINNVQLLFV